MDNPIAFGIVVLSIVLSFVISYMARHATATTEDFYVAGGKVSWRLNGVAMFGDYCSAASFLGVAGAIALAGVDSWWIALGFFGAWITVLLVMAGPLKNAGKYTVGDILVARVGGRGVKLLAMSITIVLGVLYLVPQLVGAGHLFQLLLGWDYTITVLVSGIFMGLMVVVGGMLGTTWNQAVQGVMLLTAMIILMIAASVMYFGGNPFNIISQAGETVAPTAAARIDSVKAQWEQRKLTPEALAAAEAAPGTPADSEAAAQAADAAATRVALEAARAEPHEAVFAQSAEIRAAAPDAPSGMTAGAATPDMWSQISLVLGLLLGVAGLPHILIRFYTVKDARAAQKGAVITIWGLAIFYLAVIFVGLAIMMVLYPALVGYLIEGQRGMATNMAVPLLSIKIAGEPLLGVVAAGAMAAMLSTAVGLLISMTTSLSHDAYAGVFRPNSSDKERVAFAKIGAVVLTVIAILASLWLKDQNVAILVAMCFGIAASTFAPAILLSLWWRGLTKEGIIAGMVIGLVVSLTFTFARFLNVPDIFGIRVLGNPALYGVPVAFLSMYLVSLFTSTRGNVDEFMAVAHRD